MRQSESSTRAPKSLNEQLPAYKDRVFAAHAETAVRDSQEMFEALVTASAQIVWTTDPNGIVVEDSPSWRAFTGQTFDQYKGFGSLDVIHPADVERTLQVWSESLRSGKPLFVEFRLHHISGEWRWVAARGVPLFRTDGTIRGWVGMNMDITVQKEFEEQERDRQLQILADSIPQLAWIADSKGSIFWYNQRWYEYTGTTPTEVHGWGWQQVHDPDVLPQVLEQWRTSLSIGEAFEMEFPLRGVDGIFRWFLTRVVPVRDSAGAVIRWYGTNTDVDAIRRTKDALASSEARFRAAIEATSDILWTNNIRGEMEGEQPGWSSFTGQSYYEYQGYGWSHAVHPDDAQPTIDEWKRSVADRRLFAFEHRVRRHDGEWRLCSIRAVPVLDEQEHVREWVGIHKDITEERNLLNAIRASEQRLRIVTDSVKLGLVVVSREHRYIFANHAYLEILSLPFNDIVGSRVADVLGSAYEQQIRPRLDRAFAGETVTYELALSGRDKRDEHRFSVIYQPSSGVDGAPVVVVVIFDITERVRAEEALRRSNQDLEQFAYAASHDLQEPLRMVAAYTQMLAWKYRGKIDPEADQFITHAVEGAKRMGTLLDGLLQYSCDGGSRETPLRADCVSVFQQVLDNLNLLIRDTGAFVTHDPLPPVQVAAVHVLELFQNLIENAIKYRAQTPPRIHVSARPRGEWNYFEVADNGIGIKPEHAERIFGVFRRLHHERCDGAGIGLAICKRIVERSGGRIWVESEPGQGARFCFTLPALDIQ
jgi:PAS domain S-box-containing protein